MPRLSDITTRCEIKPGDIASLISLHAELYYKEYGYGIQFECYVAAGLAEFYRQYNPSRNRVWICEHKGKMIGFLSLMDRGRAAQLRYFIIHPDYRGTGLGNKLMKLYMTFLKQCGYRSAYLWTTHEQVIAARLYQKHGFKLIEEKPSDAFGKSLKEHKYELILEP